MAYRAGVSPTVAKVTGLEACDPHFVCDDCGAKRLVTKTAMFPLWFMKLGPKPPGWTRWLDQSTRCKPCSDDSRPGDERTPTETTP